MLVSPPTAGATESCCFCFRLMASGLFFDGTLGVLVRRRWMFFNGPGGLSAKICKIDLIGTRKLLVYENEMKAKSAETGSSDSVAEISVLPS